MLVRYLAATVTELALAAAVTRDAALPEVVPVRVGYTDAAATAFLTPRRSATEEAEDFGVVVIVSRGYRHGSCTSPLVNMSRRGDGRNSSGNGVSTEGG